MFSRVRRVLQFTKPEHRWHFDLFALRKLQDHNLHKRVGFSRLSSKLTDELLTTLNEQPASAMAVARQLRRAGRGAEVLEIIENIWETRAPRSAEWSLACARVWYDSGNTWRGDIALSQGFELQPESVELFKELARNRRHRGNMSPSIDAVARILELDPSAPDDREWDEVVGIQLFEAAQFDAALPYLEKLTTKSNNWRDFYRLAVAQEETGDTAGAAQSYEDASRHRSLALSSELRVPELHAAADDMLRALSSLNGVTPEAPKVELEWRALRMEALLNLERPHEALEVFAASDSHPPRLRVLAGLAHELDGSPDAAMEEYGHALRAVRPRRTAQLRELTLRRQLARTASLVGDEEAALSAWRGADARHFKLTGLEPEPSPRFPGLVKEARVLLSAGDFDGAVPVLRKLAVSSSTRVNNARVQWHLGVALAEVGRTAEALEAFARGNETPLPDPREARDEPPRARRTELYAERRESLLLDRSVVLYESFHGAKTACNPLELCRALLASRPDLQHVWAIRDGAPIHEDLLADSRVSFIRIHSDGYYRHLATAGTLINNTSFPPAYIRRPGQRYINTWHGVPWKRLGREVPGDAYAFGNIARNILQATDLVLPNEHTATVLLGAQDVADVSAARVHITGHPRVDSTLGMTAARSEELRQALGVQRSERVVFYAPTWRGSSDGVEAETAAFMGAVSRLSSAPGVHVVVRVHHFLSAELESGGLPANVTVAPDTIDTNELLAITDVLVSDYSSVIFDFAPLNRPILKYVYDYAEYAESRGLYFGLDDVPGVNVDTEDGLLSALLEAPEHVDWSASATAHLWAHEDGAATARAIESLLVSNDEPTFPESDRIALNVVSLNPNGITRSLRNLLSAAPDIAKRVRLVLPSAALKNVSNLPIADELHEQVNFTILMSATVGTRRENYAWRRLRVFRHPLSVRGLEQITSLMQRERQRHFAGVQFLAAIDFDGYGLYQTALVGIGFPDSTRTASVLHNEFEMERQIRFPILAATAQLLPLFDALPSVSESVMVANRDALAEQFGVPPELHVELPNTINPALIRELGNEKVPDDIADWMAQPGTHVVVAGRLSTEKNHDGFLQGLAEFVSSHDAPLYATFLGDGPKAGDLRSSVKKLGLSERVFFAGYRANPYPAIKMADVLFVSSTHEGQSLVLLEAMTLGTPVVSTDIPGPASVLRGGELGVLVPPTAEGIARGLRQIVEGDLISSDAFDPDAYLDLARGALEQVIDG